MAVGRKRVRGDRNPGYGWDAVSVKRKSRMRVIKAAPEPAKRKREESNLLARIRLAIGARTDFLVTRINTGVFSAPGDPKSRIRSAPNGFPDLIGTQLRRVMCRRIREHTFGRHEEDIWHYYGQAVAIETKSTRGELSESQWAWKRSFESMGGLYVLARAESDVLDILGPVTEREP